jgi:hypothetical protein
MSSTGTGKANELRTGCAVPSSGIYRVIHQQHRLPREITLLKDHFFPRCSRCNESVYYTLERSAPAGISPYDFNVTLYELPELKDDEAVAG